MLSPQPTLGRQAGGDQLVIRELDPGAMPAWNYTTEPETWRLDEADLVLPNHVVIYGQVVASTPGSAPATANIGEAWDFVGMNAVGEERYRGVLDRMLTTVAQAGKRAALDLQKYQRAGVAGSLVVPGNPLLEIWDVLSVTDSRVSSSAAVVRIRDLHQRYDRQKAINDLLLTLEGV